MRRRTHRTDRRRALPLLAATPLLAFALALAPPVAAAPQEAVAPADPAAPAAEDPGYRAQLDGIREDIVALRFEKALAAIGALLGEGALSESQRAEAWILRAQAHVALGDLAAAETDYREILRLRPGYVPEASLITPKAQERFDKVKKEIVGTLIVKLDPPNASISIDGRPVVPGAEGAISVVAGTRRLEARADGHDPVAREVAVAAGKIEVLDVTLTPNARTVVVRTDVPGVRVLLDGVPVGETQVPERSGALPVPQLVLENLPLGEHTYDFTKDCYRDERVREILNVDLLDRSPRVMETVRMQPTRSTLELSGGPEGARVTIDGEPVGTLPLDPVETCPATRTVEIEYGGRRIWRSEERFLEASTARLEIRPRPNLALLGAEAYPPPLLFLATRFNTSAGLALPRGRDLSEPGGWRGLELPPHTDIALAVVPAERAGARDRWHLWSPILGIVRTLDAPPDGADRPAWRVPVWGLGLADGARAGKARVVRVDEGSPAARAGLRPGDALLALDGTPVADARAAREALRAVRAGQVQVEWTSAAAGETRSASLTATWSPWLAPSTPDPDEAIFRAGWALVDSLGSGIEASAALCNLALLFGAFDQTDLAVETWRRVRWGTRDGVGDGTVQYHLGRELERSGKEEPAVAAYRRAAASEARAFDDEGPPIAPAARDRLADLGVAVDAP